MTPDGYYPSVKGLMAQQLLKCLEQIPDPDKVFITTNNVGNLALHRPGGKFLCTDKDCLKDEHVELDYVGYIDFLENGEVCWNNEEEEEGEE